MINASLPFYFQNNFLRIRRQFTGTSSHHANTAVWRQTNELIDLQANDWTRRTNWKGTRIKDSSYLIKILMKMFCYVVQDTIGESILVCSGNNVNAGKTLIGAELKPLSSCLDADNFVSFAQI